MGTADINDGGDTDSGGADSGATGSGRTGGGGTGSGKRPSRTRKGPRARQEWERTRHPTEVRRRLVVEAAREVLAAKGLMATGIRDIATASGVSPGTISYHFRSLDEIFADVLKLETELFYEPLIQQSSDAPTAREALNVLIRKYFSSDPETLVHWRLWLDFWAAAAHDTRLTAWHTERYDLWVDFVEKLILRGIEAGEFAPRKAAEAAVEFTALLDGLVMQTFFTGSHLSTDEARRRLSKYVEERLGR
jgi:AcrR family transcriptional regulator